MKIDFDKIELPGNCCHIGLLASVNGKMCFALIDTGTTTTIFDKEFA